jgi:hypothetical protein
MKYLFRKYPKEYYETLKELGKRNTIIYFFLGIKISLAGPMVSKKVIVARK